MKKLGSLGQDYALFQQCFETCKNAPKDDFRWFFLLGSAQVDASKLSNISLSEKEKLVFAAQENLEHAVEASMRQDYASLYSLGHLYLMLVRFIGNNLTMDASQVTEYLNNAVSCFQDTLEIQPQSGDSMINLAVAKAKLARITKDATQKERLYEASFRQYEIAATVVTSHSLHFDFGNALYRLAKEKYAQSDKVKGLQLMTRAVDNFAKSLRIRKTLEAWINLGVAMEKIIVNTNDTDFLVDAATLYFSMQSFDAKRSGSVRARIQKAAAGGGKLLQICGAKEDLSGSHSPGEPHLKQSDDYLDVDVEQSPRQQPQRRGSVLTSFRKFIRARNGNSSSGSSGAEEPPEFSEDASDSFDYASLAKQQHTYIAPNQAGPDFQGDTLM